MDGYGEKSLNTDRKNVLGHRSMVWLLQKIAQLLHLRYHFIVSTSSGNTDLLQCRVVGHTTKFSLGANYEALQQFRDVRV